MSWQPRYPNGKTKALTFSYDDGQVFDKRLVSLFNTYGLKSTFHLNSGTLGQEGFIAPGEVAALYKGHEVSCHGATHPSFTNLSRDELVQEVWEDRRALEALVGAPVTGMSYPFGIYSNTVADTLTSLGIEYARTVEDVDFLFWPEDFMRWHPTCHHNKAAGPAEFFLRPAPYMALPLLYIWGHSYEFDREDNWAEFEQLCASLAGMEDVWYATNIEIKRYICALRGLVFSVDKRFLHNPSGVPVHGLLNGKDVCVQPGETVEIA